MSYTQMYPRGISETGIEKAYLFSPMERRSPNVDGSDSQRLFDYHVRRAEGGLCHEYR
jgi:hypothetical protein